MKAKIISDMDAAMSADVNDPRLKKRDDGRVYWPAGTVLDDPRAFRLVQMGVAEPADQECTLRAAMTSAEMKAAQRQQEMVSKGIHPDDYQRFLDGEILGYDENGDDIPGPNWKDDDDD